MNSEVILGRTQTNSSSSLPQPPFLKDDNDYIYNDKTSVESVLSSSSSRQSGAHSSPFPALHPVSGKAGNYQGHKESIPKTITVLYTWNTGKDKGRECVTLPFDELSNDPLQCYVPTGEDDLTNSLTKEESTERGPHLLCGNLLAEDSVDETEFCNDYLGNAENGMIQLNDVEDNDHLCDALYAIERNQNANNIYRDYKMDDAFQSQFRNQICQKLDRGGEYFLPDCIACSFDIGDDD